MTTRITLTAMLFAAVAPLGSAAETLSPAATAPLTEQLPLATYTAPLEVMFGIVEKINAHLSSVKDEETAELAGAAIQELLRPLNTQAEIFSKLPAPTPEVQAELDAWFAEKEHIMLDMVQKVEQLQDEDPAFFGSQTLIAAIVMVGGVLGGAE
ncbi:MAG: hypothetical protein IKL98_01190 [Akkermansia sp.]|nr:hypothetical protein [Akkermansia sp.]MBR3943747.1 hypothetical protein [Akkermansia sp.]